MADGEVDGLLDGECVGLDEGDRLGALVGLIEGEWLGLEVGCEMILNVLVASSESYMRF